MSYMQEVRDLNHFQESTEPTKILHNFPQSLKRNEDPTTTFSHPLTLPACLPTYLPLRFLQKILQCSIWHTWFEFGNLEFNSQPGDWFSWKKFCVFSQPFHENAGIVL